MNFELRCFNNGIRRKFAEFPLAPTLGRYFNLKFRWKNNVIYFAKRKYPPHFRRRGLGQSRARIPSYIAIPAYPGGIPRSPSDRRTFSRALLHTVRQAPFSHARTAPSNRRRSHQRRPRLQAYRITFDSALLRHRSIIRTRAVRIRRVNLRRSGTLSAAPEKEKCLTNADTIPYRIEFTRARSCRNEGSGSKRLRSCEFR